MKFLFEELRTFSPTVAIVDTEPLGIVFKVNCNFILVRLTINAFMGDCSISFQMRSHVPTY